MIDPFQPYISSDRRRAMARGEALPEQQHGAAVFADISGFTPLTEALVRVLGPQRGAEELPVQLNRIYDALIAEVHRYGGSVIAFAGDAITCWFNDDDPTAAASLRATVAAFAMQQAMAHFAQITMAGVGSVAMAIKVSVASGPVRRFAVGDPAIQLIDVLTGATIDRLADGEHLAQKGEVVLDAATVAQLGADVTLAEWRVGPAGERFAVIGAIAAEALPAPRSDADQLPATLGAEQMRPWLLPPVYERLRSGLGEFLTELRPAVALFLRFSGIDYDGDPDAGAQLDSYIRFVQSIVERYGGFLLQFSTGDKGTYLFIAFGAPLAHEDDAERAVAAALELRTARFPFITTVQIGIAQGRMRTGAYGATSRRIYGALGDAANVAARLMQHAAPGQVLVSAPIQRAAKPFAWEALPPLSVKGRAEPVPVYQLLGAGRQSGGFAFPSAYALPMVGRAGELSLISERLGKALQGRGQVIGIAAEAGMGKSRLVAEAVERAQAAGMACYSGECQSYGTTIAYLAWRPIWQALFGVNPELPPEERIRNLEALLSGISPELAVQMPLLSTLLELSIDDNDITRPIPAPARKQILEQILAGFLRGRAAAGPLCIVLEDCHWIDALSGDLLAILSAASVDLPVLIILAYRSPEIDRQSRLRREQISGLTEITLPELSAAESGDLVALKIGQLFAEEAVPPSVVTRIIDQAQGNPFYVEELMNYLRDRGIRLSDPTALANLELPASLQSLVLSRIDALAENQQLTVKIASVIGRRFLVNWLYGLYPVLGETPEPYEDLQILQRVDLAMLDTPEPELAYLFKHIITREVAYESLPVATRQRLHERLAEFLEQTMAAALPVDLLAYHYGLSGNRAKEAQYCALASDLAIRNGAYQDAYAYVQRALAIVSVAPESPERLAQEVGLQLTLGTILLVIRGQGSAEAKAAYDTARELGRHLPPGPELSRALFGMWTYYLFQGMMIEAEELAGEALALAQMAGDPGILIMAHLAMSQTMLWSGNWEACETHTNRVYDLYDPALHRMYITHYAQNPRFTAGSSGFNATWALGYPDTALQQVRRMITEAAELNHEFTMVIAYQCLPLLAYLTRQVDLLAASVGEYVTRAQRSGNPFYTALALALDGWRQVAQTGSAAGLQQLLTQHQVMQALGSLLAEPFIVTVVADAHLRMGRYADGLAILDTTRARFVANRHCAYLPEHLRLRGELLVGLGDREVEAEAAFREAIAVAREQTARTLELRAATSLARLLAARGEGAAARAELTPIFAWFTEGRDAPDWLEAEAVLGGIAAS